MNCKEIEKRILNGEKSDSVIEHSENCEECRLLLESMDLADIDISVSRDIPSHIEKAIFSEAESRCSEYRHRRFMNFFAYAAGLIAAAGVIVSVVISSNRNKNSKEHHRVCPAVLCSGNCMTEQELPQPEIDREFSGIETELDMLDTDISLIEDEYSPLLNSADN